MFRFRKLARVSTEIEGSEVKIPPVRAIPVGGRVCDSVWLDVGGCEEVHLRCKIVPYDTICVRGNML